MARGPLPQLVPHEKADLHPIPFVSALDRPTERPDALAELASRAFGRRIELRFATPTTNATSVQQTPETAEVSDHPLVREAMELFDAHVVQVRPASGRPATPAPEGADSPKDSD